MSKWTGLYNSRCFVAPVRSRLGFGRALHVEAASCSHKCLCCAVVAGHVHVNTVLLACSAVEGFQHELRLSCMLVTLCTICVAAISGLEVCQALEISGSVLCCTVIIFMLPITNQECRHCSCREAYIHLLSPDAQNMR